MQTTSQESVASEISPREDQESLAICFEYCSLLFTYPNNLHYPHLATAHGFFAHQHQALVNAPSPAIPEQERLQYEYTALFAANPDGLPAAPYASCYLSPDGDTYTETTHQLARLMRSYGVEPDREAGEPADHIATIMAFCALLTRNSDDPAALADLHAVIEATLLPWIGQFAHKIELSGLSMFYTAAARFCQTLIEHHAELFATLFSPAAHDTKEDAPCS